MTLFYILMRNPVNGQVSVAPYYAGLAVFQFKSAAHRRVRSLRRGVYRHWLLRILPWHTEMGEVDRDEMWRSALRPNHYVLRV